MKKLSEVVVLERLYAYCPKCLEIYIDDCIQFQLYCPNCERVYLIREMPLYYFADLIEKHEMLIKVLGKIKKYESIESELQMSFPRISMTLADYNELPDHSVAVPREIEIGAKWKTSRLERFGGKLVYEMVPGHQVQTYICEITDDD